MSLLHCFQILGVKEGDGQPQQEPELKGMRGIGLSHVEDARFAMFVDC